MTLIGRGIREFAVTPVDATRLEAVEAWRALPETYRKALTAYFNDEKVPDYTLSRARKVLGELMDA